LEVWRLEALGSSKVRGNEMKMVAGVKLEDKMLAADRTGPGGKVGCCANAVWVN